VSNYGIALLVIVCVLVVLFALFLLPGLWFRALISGTYIPVHKILRMRMKRLDVREIVMGYIKARKSGVEVSVEQLENHAQAKGNVDNVINACIAAVNADIKLPIKTAMAIDLSGRDINQAVKNTITPRVIETPVVATVTRSGVEMFARAKITIKANLTRIIGGALEETIIARVSEGIVTCIGSAMSHSELLENPDSISRRLIEDRNISRDAAYDVVSIDISKIEVGRNVGAELAIDEAESRKIISQADAEQRRSDALAAEQEMRALTQEMRARVIASEANIPTALAHALERGSMTVQQFQQLENVIADTQMRKKIAGAGGQDMLPSPKKSRLA